MQRVFRRLVCVLGVLPRVAEHLLRGGQLREFVIQCVLGGVQRVLRRAEIGQRGGEVLIQPVQLLTQPIEPGVGGGELALGIGTVLHRLV